MVDDAGAAGGDGNSGEEVAVEEFAVDVGDAEDAESAEVAVFAVDAETKNGAQRAPFLLMLRRSAQLVFFKISGLVEPTADSMRQWPSNITPLWMTRLGVSMSP